VISGKTKGAGQHDIWGTGVTLYFVCGTYPTPVPCTSTNSWSFDLNSQNTYLNITAATTAPVNGAVPISRSWRIVAGPGRCRSRAAEAVVRRPAPSAATCN
jgi:hypothetical protein